MLFFKNSLKTSTIDVGACSNAHPSILRENTTSCKIPPRFLEILILLEHRAKWGLPYGGSQLETPENP